MPQSHNGEAGRQAGHVIIAGARSMVAAHLLRHLAARGYGGVCLSRNPDTAPPLPEAFVWRREEELTARERQGALVFSLAPLDRAAPFLAGLEDAARIVATSSARVVYERGFPDPVVSRLRESEEHLRAVWTGRGLRWTLLRPTMIYEPWRDANVSRIARLARRFRAVPVLAPAGGLVQPVHGADVARAMLAAAGNGAGSGVADGLTLDLPGGETLSFREMVIRIFAGLGLPPRLLSIPPWLLHTGLFPLTLAGRGQGVLEAFRRMNRDRIVDGGPAGDILKLSPRPFRPEFPVLPEGRE